MANALELKYQDKYYDGITKRHTEEMPVTRMGKR